MHSSLQSLIPEEELNLVLTREDIASFSKHLVDWAEKARGLGLEEGEIDEIREDYSKSKLKKRAVLTRWREIQGDKATLKELLMTAEQKGWMNFIDKVAQELGYVEEGEGCLKYNHVCVSLPVFHAACKNKMM